MLWVAVILLTAIIGIMAGWFARDVRDLFKKSIETVAEQRKSAAVTKNDGSGVIVNKEPYQRGQVVNLPHYDLKDTGIVRARSPKQVKQDSDREWNKTLDEYR